MNETWLNILKICGGAAIPILGGILLNAMGWIRFSSKDKADISKVQSETAVDLAEVASKRIEDEVLIAKTALEWTVQLAAQLERSNGLNDRRSGEIERLHTVIQAMRDDFDQRLDEINNMLDLTRNELVEERNKNRVLLDKLNAFIDGK